MIEVELGQETSGDSSLQMDDNFYFRVDTDNYLLPEFNINNIPGNMKD